MIYYYSAPSNYENELKENGCNTFLLSFAIDSKNWERFHNKEMPLIIDSGAFSAWNKGHFINKYDYLRFCKTLPEETIFINLDVIPKTGCSVEEADACCRESFMNFQLLKKELKNVMPVFHYKDDPKWLHKYLEYVDYIGISPANDTHENIKQMFLDSVFKQIDPTKVKTHALGYTAPKGLRKYPFYSVDSISYKSADMFGNIIVYKEALMDFSTIDLWEWNLQQGLGYTDAKDRALAKAGVSYNIRSVQKLMRDVTELHKTKDFSYLKSQLELF